MVARFSLIAWFLLLAINLNALLYDPFQLTLDCSHLNHCALKTEESKEILFIHLDIVSEVEKILEQARLQQNMLDITTTSLKRDWFCIKVISHNIQFQAPVLNVLGVKDDVIKIADQKIALNIITVKRQNISIDNFFGFSYVTITHNDQTHRYWLTDEQTLYLSSLLNANTPKLEIVIDALLFFGHYRNMMLASYVFKAVSHIN